MRYIIFISIYSIFLLSCNKPKTKNKVQELKSKIATNYFIAGSIKNFYPSTVYLNKIIENSIYSIDSASIINNTFQFNGSISHPERFALTFNNYSSAIAFIIENDSIQIAVDFENIEEPIITGSSLNNEMKNYTTSSKKIFKKIEYLFPKFQKARLENNATQLKLLNNEMNAIEEEYHNFAFTYIEKNASSYVSAMILRDQLKRSKLDTTRVINSYHKLSNEVKKSPDAEIIAMLLNLH